MNKTTRHAPRIQNYYKWTSVPTDEIILPQDAETRKMMKVPYAGSGHFVTRRPVLARQSPQVLPSVGTESDCDQREHHAKRPLVTK
jgi:hypothetical protein